MGDKLTWEASDADINEIGLPPGPDWTLPERQAHLSSEDHAIPTFARLSSHIIPDVVGEDINEREIDRDTRHLDSLDALLGPPGST